MRPLFTAVALLSALAVEAAPVFRTLEEPQPTAVKAGEIELIEFFSWGCPACYRVEPQLKAFLATAPKGVVLKRVPATFEPTFAKLAPVFYVAEALGVTAKVSEPMFAAMHDPAAPRDLRDALQAYRRAEISRGDVETAKQAFEAAVARLFEKHAGVKPAVFRATWYSPAIRVRLAEGATQFRTWRVNSVPAFGVDGRFLASADPSLGVRTLDDVMTTMRAAVAEASAARR